MEENNLTFEQAMSELESIVKKLEEGKLSIEESIQSYERGTILKKVCEKKLQDIKLRVEKITFSEGRQQEILEDFDPRGV